MMVEQRRPGPAEARRSLERALLDHSGTGLVGVGPDGVVVLVNAAARALLGLSSEPGTLAALHAAPGLPPAERVRLASCLAGDTGCTERLMTEEGVALLATRRVVDGNTLMSLAPAGFAEAAPGFTDALTGLSNRRLFDDRLQAFCAKGTAFALLLIDLDRFKFVNDTMGHQAGDALLSTVGARLRATLRQADVISRFGGDEFAVALPATPDIVAVGERIVSVLSRPYLIERRAVVVGASVGIVLAPAHGSTPAELVRAADLALYQAKAEGRGVVRLFDRDLDHRARDRCVLADELRRAIPLRQLQLHFQPQISLATGELTGFEALVRWLHPERGIMPPDQFIPLAEEMGLILPLGEWVMREACQQAMTWPRAVNVAVNVSPKQLLDRQRLPKIIAASLAATGLEPSRLEIEITETALLHESEALEVLHAIRGLGVSVSMDDFGTGYSSLSQLRRFPFDKIKIDRSFISDLGNSEEAAGVVRAISALGRSLGMTTVAEGVETEDQKAICQADGCASMQGYLVSRPVPAGDVSALVVRLAGRKPGNSHVL